jgi:branched-chain amino acid transport system substrate-binding protein
MNEATREWTRRFRLRHNTPPTMLHAGGYAAMTHYLKAIEAAGTDEPTAVAKKMKEMPVNDIYNKNVRIREDGRVMHDMYLAEVKSPSEMENDWDLYRILAKLPGDQVFRPIDEGGCALVKAK